MQVIREAGERYGCALAGWWIDDAVTGYYSAAPPWRSMWRALKVYVSSCMCHHVTMRSCDDVMMWYYDDVMVLTR